MEKKIIKLSLVVIMIFTVTATFAQPGGIGGGTPAGGLPPGGAGAPIDGGVSALLIGIIGYAYNLLKGKKEA